MVVSSDSIVFHDLYWAFYLDLEKQALEIARYVDLDRANFKTFSIELLKLLQATCGEIDSLAKELAIKFNPNREKQLTEAPICKWWYYLTPHLPELPDRIARVQDKIELAPWKGFACREIELINKYGDASIKYGVCEGSEVPGWWTAYNRVKHRRTARIANTPIYHLANLGNALNALAALYLLEREYIQKERFDWMVGYEGTRLFGGIEVIDAY